MRALRESRKAVNTSREKNKNKSTSGTKVKKISDAFPKGTELKYLCQQNTNQTETTSVKMINLPHIKFLHTNEKIALFYQAGSCLKLCLNQSRSVHMKETFFYCTVNILDA